MRKRSQNGFPSGNVHASRRNGEDSNVKDRRNPSFLLSSPKTTRLLIWANLSVFVVVLFYLEQMSSTGIDMRTPVDRLHHLDSRRGLGPRKQKEPFAMDEHNHHDDRLETCQYDGHCPTGSTCAVSPATSFGVCEPIAALGPKNGIPADEACRHTCQAELELDEHFYQEEWPVLEWSEQIRSRGRPTGCVLGFHREPEGDRWKEREAQSSPSLLEEWMSQRFRYVVRIDPFESTNMQDNRWISYCFQPCESDSDCATSNDDKESPGFLCDNRVCRRNVNYWEDDTEESSMVLVTGATKAYFRGLQNLAASARYWAPTHKMVVYNLGGLSELHMNEIRSWSNVLSVEWEEGMPASYPPHVGIGKVYAWKPLIVNETLTKYKSIFWLDAGSTLAGPITPAIEIVQRTGMFLVKGQDLDMRLSHAKAYEWFNTTKSDLQTGPHFSGNTQAFLYPSRYYTKVVEPNARCALDPNCISPSGSGLGNHRYDQTTISILAYMPKVRAPHYTEYLAAQITQLSKDMKQPSTKFVWTARQHCQFYHNLEKAKGLFGRR